MLNINKLEGFCIKPKLLIVDDDTAVADLIRLFVAPEFHCEVCNNPSQSLALIEKTSYDVILTDLNMNEISGLNVISHAKQFQPKTPIVVMSGSSEVDLAKAMSLGATGFLGKPFDGPDQVRSALLAVLAKP